jgi:epoxyqueuosine reductase QueG
VDRAALESHAREAGADLFGVADLARFAQLPVEKHPRALFPETRSVVVVGRRIPRGALRGVEEGSNFTNYNFYGDLWLDNNFTSLVTCRVAEALEDAGWEGVPVPNLPPEIPPLGVAVRPGQPPPNVMLDLADAAVRAGVGEIGYCRHLLTPQFGPRQRIQMILTDAELEPTPLREERICPGPAQCGAACPLGALAGEEELTVGGRRVTVAAVDWSACGRCKNGARPNRHHPAGRPDRLAAACARACVDFLERSGRVSNRLALPLRVRPPWSVLPDADLWRI